MISLNPIPYCRWTLPIASLAILLYGAPTNAAGSTEALGTFLAEHCFSCHDSDVQKAELDLEALMRGGTPDMADAATWETALHMIATGEMPPEKKKQPTQEERDIGTASIEEMLRKWTESLGENPGRVTVRRLNRDEYNNTIRDLVGVDFKPAQDFPRDEVGYGFDNIGDVLSLSPVLMERYLDAAEQIVDKAIVAEIPEWPPVERPALDDFQLLSWEEKLLKLPLKGEWKATFDNSENQESFLTTLTFPDSSTVKNLVVEGKRVRFSAHTVIDKKSEEWSITAEERSTGHLSGQWIRGDQRGTFQAIAVPGHAFAGEWNAVATLPDGRDLQQTLTIEGKETLRGKLVTKADKRTNEIDEIQFDDASIHLHYGIQMENQAMDVQVTASLEDDGILRGGWVLKGGDGNEVATGTWRAEKPEPRDEANNVRIMGRAIGLHREGEARIEFDAKEAGNYRLSFSSYQQKAGPENAKLGLYLNGIELTPIDVTWQKPRTQSRTISLSKGKHSIGIAYLNNYVNNRTRDRNLRGDRNLYVRNIELAGPLGKPSPPLPESHRRIIPSQPEAGTERDAARKFISEFASRAYRRPATHEEVERLSSLVDGVLGDGGSFGEGMRLACQAILVSPHFLFRWEMDSRHRIEAKNGIRNLNAYEIASRLSYFLWSSMPDDELFALAMDGSLLHKDVIRTQVERMLTDNRSEALVRNFAGQWLQIRNLDSVEPDAETFPEFDASLRTSMAEETYLFFEAILREDRSVMELLNADFTFLNQRLVEHYGLERDDLGDEFQRVNLSDDSRRGGVLTQASILTITSNPRRTSPVTRGKWVLEQILGTPPPPPPPNVPELEEDKEIAAEASLRERMKIHRDNPDCAGCHAKMDPIGFALENFDGIGRWRDFDGKFPIDSAVTLGDGSNVSGPDSLKQMLTTREEYLNSFTEKMLTYALGRGVEFFDRPAVKTIQDSAAKSGFKLSTIVTEIACSDPFLKRTIENAKND